MSFSKMSDWGGVFEPVVKHRYHNPPPGEKHPEHLINHIRIASIVPLTDEEIEDYEEEIHDYELDQLLHLGDGNRPWIVEVWFVPDQANTYYYVINEDEFEDTGLPDLGNVLQLIADATTPSG